MIMNIYKKKFLTKDGIIHFDIQNTVTKKVINFYTKHPFPNYEYSDNRFTDNWIYNGTR